MTLLPTCLLIRSTLTDDPCYPEKLTDNTCVKDLAQLKKDLRASGHNETMMEELQLTAAQSAIENKLYGHEPTRENIDQKVFQSNTSMRLRT